uniref:ATP synthase complex subunit 8 n=1 Tax=Cacopsylla burckhardti TaxID=2593410 RepID=A0A8K1SPM7_9HEMI|nr:ATP synthase F0 subunit 8 [Cacopsylla burckhardti]UFP91881.1 ATP synthase F0 subunit 8 [Cacopsylla burckhardti]WAK85084.1 ATP synthase F0 subunit 8 [Cacopsylla burckhardti]
MPQMAPLPWVLLLILTILTLLYVSTIIFFSVTKKSVKNYKKFKNNFLIKW